jgi:hypothetical protein
MDIKAVDEFELANVVSLIKTAVLLSDTELHSIRLLISDEQAQSKPAVPVRLETFLPSWLIPL